MMMGPTMPALMHPRVRQLALAATLVSIAIASACGGDKPSGPQAGDLTVRLTTPYTDDGALLLHVTGPEIAAVSAASSASTVHARTGAGGYMVAVFGDLGAGPLVRITVPDVRQASRYTVTVVEAADRANAIRATLGGYAFTVGR
ncbi:MAG: hypothetical protein WKG32_11620 [Gemmatimonadaceae bacterium]